MERRGPGTGGPHGRRMPEKPKNLKKALHQLIAYLRPQLPVFWTAIAFALIGSVLSIFGPSQISRMTDLIKNGLSTGIDMKAMAGVGILMIMIYLGSALSIYLQSYLLAGFNQKLSKRMRGEISGKINRLPLSYFNFHETGDVLSRMTNDVDTIGMSLSNSLASIITSAAQFVGCLLMMFLTNWILALVSILSTFLAMVLMIIIMAHSQKYFSARQKNLGALNGYIEEMYTGHGLIRTLNAEKSVKAQFDSLNQDVRTANYKSQFFARLMQPIMNLVGNLGYVAVCVIGAVLTINGSISFGVITAFMIYVRMIENPVRQISQAMTNMQSAAAASERVFEFLGKEELSDESGKAEKHHDVKGTVVFDHVKFAYPDKPDEVIIHDFSVSVKPGQKVAIVGPTGAGKTTLVNLLMRFYETIGGEIRIDGVKTTDMTREAVHDCFGMVLQDTWLFEGTVRENLVYNTPDVTDEQMKAACKACGIHSFIKMLPNGYDTVLSDNTAISAGQKQLMTIARAMIQNSPMLILDEATSSVDTRTEQRTQKAMDHLTENRTSFVIAHRLSTIRNADIILVIRDGDIVEQGDHESLLAKNGFYASLYNSQFEAV